MQYDENRKISVESACLFSNSRVLYGCSVVLCEKIIDCPEVIAEEIVSSRNGNKQVDHLLCY